jgi:lysophospholipase L1-like esterase
LGALSPSSNVDGIGLASIVAWTDGFVDFDRAIRDPANPESMLPAFDSGDGLHPNDAGDQAMANAIDLRLYRQPPACADSPPKRRGRVR